MYGLNSFPCTYLLSSLHDDLSINVQPPNVYEFGARYFSELIEQRKSGVDGIIPGDLSQADLEAHVSSKIRKPALDVNHMR